MIRPDLLRNIFPGIIEHVMDWIEGLLTVHHRLDAFDDIWALMPSYLGKQVLRKPYRQLGQVQGKKMRAIMCVLLIVLTASPRRKTLMPRLTGGQQQDSKNAIQCVGYMTDFGLIALYHSHADSIVHYMPMYARQFHETKYVFLRYCAGKEAPTRADGISKKYSEESTRSREEAKGLTVAQWARLAEDDQAEKAHWIDKACKEDSHFNFHKLHLLSHYADQIDVYGSFPQYSTEICEAMPKPFKDAHRRSNHVASIPLVIDTYTRAHNFALRELNMQHWATKDPSLVEDLQILLRRRRDTNQINCRKWEALCIRLQGKCYNKTTYNVSGVSVNFNIPALVNDVVQGFTNNEYGDSRDPQADAARCLPDAEVACFRALEIPIPDQDVVEGQIYNAQYVRTTGNGLWRGMQA